MRALLCSEITAQRIKHGRKFPAQRGKVSKAFRRLTNRRARLKVGRPCRTTDSLQAKKSMRRSERSAGRKHPEHPHLGWMGSRKFDRFTPIAAITKNTANATWQCEKGPQNHGTVATCSSTSLSLIHPMRPCWVLTIYQVSPPPVALPSG